MLFQVKGEFPSIRFYSKLRASFELLDFIPSYGFANWVLTCNSQVWPENWVCFQNSGMFAKVGYVSAKWVCFHKMHMLPNRWTCSYKMGCDLLEWTSFFIRMDKYSHQMFKYPKLVLCTDHGYCFAVE